MLLSPLRLHCFHPTVLFTFLSLSHTLLFLISFGFFDNAMPVVTDHVNGHCTSPTSQPCPTGRARVPGGPEGPRLARRGPGRPPFRKAQSAACMEVSLPVSSLTEGYASRRAMLQQLHGVSMYSHDEHHITTYSWSERGKEGLFEGHKDHSPCSVTSHSVPSCGS
ncbi:hypothetical protein cypCar_00006857 [Cyprinus carpio]|nr:hypothetical protein cypCar_00006857 [Cyprinus carpio]